MPVYLLGGSGFLGASSLQRPLDDRLEITDARHSRPELCELCQELAYRLERLLEAAAQLGLTCFLALQKAGAETTADRLRMA